MQGRLPGNSSTNDNTPRGSWATFDLRNSQPDALIPGLLDHVDADTVDQLNEVRRGESGRAERLLPLCPPQQEAECVERRPTAEEPQENRARHRILVQCNKLE